MPRPDPCGLAGTERTGQIRTSSSPRCILAEATLVRRGCGILARFSPNGHSCDFAWSEFVLAPRRVRGQAYGMTHAASVDPAQSFEVREEVDTFGAIKVPAARLWGAQTQRSFELFQISSERIPREVIVALAQIKRAAAQANQEFGLLSEPVAQAIRIAAAEVIAGQHDEEFPLSVWQTGSGTQSHMNVNEVLANRASELLGGREVKTASFTPTTRSIADNPPTTSSPPP